MPILDSPDGMTVPTFTFVPPVSAALSCTCSLALAAVDMPAFGTGAGVSRTRDMTPLSSVLVLWREDIVSEGGCELHVVVVVVDDSVLGSPIEETSLC